MKFQFTNFFKGSFISKILTIILLIILFFIFSCTPPESISGCVKETACNYNSEANEDDGSCMYPDGTDGGSVQASPGNINYNCDGLCIVDIDCSDECGGDAVEDECGECDGDGVIQACGCGEPSEFGIPVGNCDCEGHVSDCAGTCGGDAEKDECGICNGDNSSCVDCAGVPNGDSW